MSWWGKQLGLFYETSTEILVKHKTSQVYQAFVVHSIITILDEFY